MLGGNRFYLKDSTMSPATANLQWRQDRNHQPVDCCSGMWSDVPRFLVNGELLAPPHSEQICRSPCR